jgi:hypothetical protein
MTRVNTRFDRFASGDREIITATGVRSGLMRP